MTKEKRNGNDLLFKQWSTSFPVNLPVIMPYDAKALHVKHSIL